MARRGSQRIPVRSRHVIRKSGIGVAFVSIGGASIAPRLLGKLQLHPRSTRRVRAGTHPRARIGVPERAKAQGKWPRAAEKPPDADGGSWRQRQSRRQVWGVSKTTAARWINAGSFPAK